MSAPVRVAALVLAAGRSERMGDANKLLAPIDGAPMVTRAVDAALASRAAPVLVVLGHESDRVREVLGDRPVDLVQNLDAAAGLASSLHAGLAALDGDAEGALICLGDMPWVRASHLDTLIESFAARDDHPICVPLHDGRRGNPVLWPARHFAALGTLRGDAGGRRLLPRYADEVTPVSMHDDAVLRDVDAPEDLPFAGLRPPSPPPRA